VEFLNFDLLTGSHDVIILNAHAKIEDTSDDSKDIVYEELEQVFGHFPKHQKKVLLRAFNLKINKSSYFKTDG